MSALRTVHVYDGRKLLGELREGVTKVEARAADGRRLGAFDNMKKAAKAVAAASGLPIGRRA